MSYSEEKHLEIEHKYLIALPSAARLLSLPGARSAGLSQTYLKSENPRDSERVRAWSELGCVRYYHTVKRKLSALCREETEKEISADAYRALLTRADPTRRTVEKTRYIVPFVDEAAGCTYTWEIDVFPFWDDRAFAEIELPGENAVFTVPPFITVLREVSEDPLYTNAALARKDSPIVPQTYKNNDTED